MKSLKSISEQANKLFKESFIECIRINDEISDNFKDTRDKQRLDIAKRNLISSAQLAGQIISSLDKGGLLLALIGLRSLVESYINTKYTFAYTDKEDKVNWANKVCEDYFKRGNDFKSIKQFLDNKKIEKRAEEVGLEDVYEKTFVSLCNYIHMQIHTFELNNPQEFEEYTVKAYRDVLLYLHNICDSIQAHFNIIGWKRHEQRIQQFINRCDLYINQLLEWKERREK